MEKQLCLVEDAILALHGGAQLLQEVQLLRPSFSGKAAARSGSFSEKRRLSSLLSGRLSASASRSQSFSEQRSASLAVRGVTP